MDWIGLGCSGLAWWWVSVGQQAEGRSGQDRGRPGGKPTVGGVYFERSTGQAPSAVTVCTRGEDGRG